MIEEYMQFTIDNQIISDAEEIKDIKHPFPKCAAIGCEGKIENSPYYKIKLSNNNYVFAHDLCFNLENLTIVNWKLV